MNRLPAYLQERFPPVNMALFGVLHLAVYSATEVERSFGALFWLGILATISFFFRLRVMDEIKDYDVDAAHHPQRVLQSGGVTLGFLMGLSAVLTLSELWWSYLHGSQTLLLWGVAFGYALLMRYEFFVGKWLRQRLVLYAFSHMLIMPLVIAWLWFAWRDAATLVLGLLMLLGLLAGFVFELARKTHAPPAERPGIDTYSSLLGVPQAVSFILVTLWLSVLVQALLFWQLALPWWTYVLALACAVWVSVAYRESLASRVEVKFRKAELATSVYMLSSYLVLIIATSL